MGSLYRGDNSSLLGAVPGALVSCRLTTPQVPKQILAELEPDAKEQRRHGPVAMTKRGETRSSRLIPREKCDAGEPGEVPTKKGKPGVFNEARLRDSVKCYLLIGLK